MIKELKKFLAKTLWPWFRKDVLPIVLAWIATHMQQILEKLWDSVSKVFNKDASAQAAHAEKQAAHADSQASRAADAGVAAAWREAAEYWRRQHEDVSARLERNLAEASKAVSTARLEIDAAIDGADPTLAVSDGSPVLTLGDKTHVLKFPEETP